MKASRGTGIVGIIGLLVFSAVFGFIGIKDREFVKRCQAVEGQAVSVTKKTSIEKTKTNPTRRKKRISYSVTYSYTMNGQEYTHNENSSASVEPGPITVLVDPANPASSHLKKPSPAFDFLVALAALVGAIVTGFKTLRATSA